jgi:DNA-binding response OmpR family regulator
MIGAAVALVILVASVTNRRLLIIDDYLSFAKFVAGIAREEGFDVEITTRAEDFKAAVLRVPPDLIVLDIFMPLMDGIELIQWLGEQRTKARVIVATGFHMEYANMVRAIGIAKGIDSISILLKPFRVTTLRAALGKDRGGPALPKSASNHEGHAPSRGTLP